jgi:cobalamin biosynthesis Mg chelatase CobN
MPEQSARDEHADALEAMASGSQAEEATETQDSEPSVDDQIDMQSEGQNDDTSILAVEVEQASEPNDEASDSDDPFAAAAAGVSNASPAESAQARQQRQARQQAMASRARHAQMSRVLFPICLVSGLLVIALGVLVLVLKPDTSSSMLSPALTRAVTFASFPLGGILVVGAWWFHHEAKHS